MQIDSEILTSHSWTLAGIVLLTATALGGIAAFIANLLKSVEVVHNLKREKDKAVPVESKPVELKVDLKDVGITPFKMAAQPIRDVMIGTVAGTTAVEIATHSHDHTPQSSHDQPSPHGTHADLPGSADTALDHGATNADTHQTITDHSDSLWGWITDIFS